MKRSFRKSSLQLARYDRAKQALMLENERPLALRQAILACAMVATCPSPAVYGGFSDKIPMGAIGNKALTLRSGQTHVHRYLRPLLERIEKGELDPSVIITHRLPLSEIAEGYSIFCNQEDQCVKVVLKP